MSDLISRQDAIEAVATVTMSIHLSNVLCDKLLALPSADAVQIPIKLEKRYPQSRDEDITDAFMRGYLAGRSSADRPTGWIPVIWHEITDEERNREGYPKDWVVYVDCEMPSDEQKILVTTRWGTVEADVCYEDGEFSLDSGYDWIDDIIAWMPLPEPYNCGAKMGGDSDG